MGKGRTIRYPKMSGILEATIKIHREEIECNKRHDEKELDYLEKYKKVLEMSTEDIILDHIKTGYKQIRVDGEDIMPIEIELLRRLLDK